ncbi:ATP-binding protein [Nocardioides pacificus]
MGWVFTAGPDSAAQARGRISQCLTNYSRQSREDVLLLTSELTTNAIRHGRGRVLVQMSWHDREVQVEVSDQSRIPPVMRATDCEATDGRGLLLVEGLSADWGVRTRDEGKTVWFIVRDEPAGRP